LEQQRQSDMCESTLDLLNNLIHTVNFALRIQNYSRRAIDNISVDGIKFSSSPTSPIISGLSDRDAQHLMINTVAAAGNFTFEAENKKNK
jgi:chromosome condensin MukBEF ATPase and DNA-binding subunit MukB